MKGYYFITDKGLSKAGVLNDVKSALTAGTLIIQYKNKSSDTRDMYEEALKIKELCLKGKAKLIINDRIDIAVAIDAHGVHIGKRDLPYSVARMLVGSSKIIGVTVNTLEEAVDAEMSGANYVGVSPVFATGTKPDAGRPCGIDELKKIKRYCKIPAAAIGGINENNIDEVIGAGADMVCAISAVLTKPDVAFEITRIQRKYKL
jgi:thiamine-phosphate pyrophosphorylase